jgi:hypothetical protein
MAISILLSIFTQRLIEMLPIISYIKLLERWELGYAERLRAKLLIKTYSSIGKQNLSEIEGLIKTYASEYKYLIGGELAASIITTYLRPISVVLHLNKETIDYHREIAVLLKLKPNPEGNITFLQNIGDYGGYEYGELTKNIIDPLLIHAELVRTGDSRLKETAQIIFDKYISGFHMSASKNGSLKYIQNVGLGCTESTENRSYLTD